MLVQEIMTKKVVTIDCNKTIFDACKTYKKNRVGSLVVMDKKIIVGIITERDIIERIILTNKNPKKTKVRNIMSTNIKTIHALASLEKANQMMRENNIKKLPVILNNEIVGIITETDLSRSIQTISEIFDKLVNSYEKNKVTIEKMMNEWSSIITSLKNYEKTAK